ncbi:peptide/nickel transport system substrate-binding protein [Kribbella aluminosa]|uniref:Peptide/nickel transport system substrate-binding protein n=1 Tax=Kribbella aluminosa TaxID=416017 RepID=A0ABS4UM16_9ACTN|nr:ABC transporter substrate-binding protein [Kribbella aluminosa]MBP2352660.1 peptide/nickel transport system substrate-binding protein [Kribbella aluminosa]
MRWNRITTATAVSAAVALSLVACGGPKASPGGGSSAGGATAEFNAAVGKDFKPSDKKGGTLRMAITQQWDSTDPGDTYYGLSWNLVRNYVRPLMTFKAAPGAEGAKPVPDLAEAPGVPSNNATTWTYKIRKGIKFEDGTPVTSKDVKYAVARSLDKVTLPNGPTYFNDFLLDIPKGYSVYKDKTLAGVAKAIETPDDNTIVFHLNKPFASFDYFAQLPSTAPVPQAKDTGAKYKEHPIATGPYKFGTYNPNSGFDLVRNDQYDPATDPDSGRKALPDKITIAYNVEGTDIDNRLLAGDLDVDLAGTGVQPETQAKILADPKLKAHADNVPAPRLNFTVLNSQVPPLDNIHCRKAVLYAADHEGYQRAYGGPIGGDIATNLMPPGVSGSEQFDDYGFKTDKNGNVDKAKAELQQCGQPNGFAMNVTYRTDRAKEKAVAEMLQQSLKRVGINLTTKPYPTGDYTKLYAGKPDFAKANKLGLIVYSWGADWNDGFGFLSQIVDSRVIRDAGGNTNLGIRIPEVDTMIDQALKTTDETARNKIWVDIDKKVMEQAAALPGIWAKGLLYRPDTLANVFTNDGQNMYDYAAIGVAQK